MNESRYQAMYGCDPQEVLDSVADPIHFQGVNGVLMSMLSDVQEMIALGDTEEARKAINRIKLVVDTHIPRPDYAALAAEKAKT